MFAPVLTQQRRDNKYRYRVTVEDFVANSDRSKLDVGQQNFPKKLRAPFSNHDKPTSYMIGKEQKSERDYISMYKKAHALDPGPKYNIGLDMS
jgi:hypothetical protein